MCENSCDSVTEKPQITSSKPVMIPKPIETLERVTYLLPAICQNKDSVSINVDTHTNKIYLETKSKVSDEIKKYIDVDNTFDIVVDKRYDVTLASVVVTDGLILIDVPVQDKRIKTIKAKSVDA